MIDLLIKPNEAKRMNKRMTPTTICMDRPTRVALPLYVFEQKQKKNNHVYCYHRPDYIVRINYNKQFDPRILAPLIHGRNQLVIKCIKALSVESSVLCGAETLDSKTED